MANEVFKGLFGFSPDELTQQRDAANQARAFQMAQLSPLQQTSYQGFKAAQGVGDSLRGIGQKLFNIEDPQMKESALLDSSAKELFSQGIDPMSSKGLTILAERVSAAGGRSETMSRLLQARQQAVMQEAKLASEQALTTSRGREQDPAMKLLESGKYTPDSVAMFKATNDFSKLKFKDPEKEVKRSGFAQQLIDQGLEPGSPEFQQKMKEYNEADISGTKTKGTKIDIQMPGAADAGKYGDAAGTQLGKDAVTVTNAQQSIIDTAQKALTFLDKGIFTGPYANIELGATKFSRGAYGSLSKVENTEKFLNYVQSNVIPMLKEFGGSDTEKELEFLKTLNGANLTAEESSIREAVVEGQRKAIARMKRLSKQVKSVQEGKPLPVGQETSNDAEENAFDKYYNSLPPGSKYVDPEGNVRTKKGSK